MVLLYLAAHMNAAAVAKHVACLELIGLRTVCMIMIRSTKVIKTYEPTQKFQKRIEGKYYYDFNFFCAYSVYDNRLLGGGENFMIIHNTQYRVLRDQVIRYGLNGKLIFGMCQNDYSIYCLEYGMHSISARVCSNNNTKSNIRPRNVIL